MLLLYEKPIVCLEVSPGSGLRHDVPERACRGQVLQEEEVGGDQNPAHDRGAGQAGEIAVAASSARKRQAGTKVPQPITGSLRASLIRHRIVDSPGGFRFSDSSWVKNSVEILPPAGKYCRHEFTIAVSRRP